MTLKEFLAVLANGESTDEQKAAAQASFEKAQQQNDEKFAALTAQVEQLTEQNKQASAKEKQAKKEAEEAERKNMSLEELKADYEKRLSDATGETNAAWQGKYDTVTNQLKKHMVDSQALKLAQELSDHPSAILPHVINRIGFDVDEKNGFSVFVNDIDGKRTAATFDDLSKEIKSVDYLKPLLKGDFSNKGTQTSGTQTGNKPANQPDHNRQAMIEKINQRLGA